MAEISATEAARNFADLLDAVEHRGERFTVVRRGKAIAVLEPARLASGADIKSILRSRRRDRKWSEDLSSVRSLLEVEDRR
jgi:prevent-host-death family protein